MWQTGIALVFVCLIFSVTTTTAGDMASADLLGEIASIGPRAVIEKLWNSSETHPNEWDLMIGKIETGDKGWLQVASSLKLAADAGASEDLNGALAVALLKNPVDVLTIVQEGPFMVSDVCICPYIGETREDEVVANKYLYEADKVLVGLKVLSDNPHLEKVRQNCLAIMRSNKADGRGAVEEGGQSIDERKAALARDSKFQAFLQRLETGDKTALADFKNIQPIVDPVKRGYVYRAMALALPDNPLGVLLLVEDGYIGLNAICRPPYEEKGAVSEYLCRSERALSDASLPLGNPKIEIIRDNCLKSIRSYMK
ncbi:MAG: hypothetical protein VB050_13340 [Geobacteraceae bacterium]|nr:hypothetical protein [Geobacteraceae bacterium]